MSSPEFELQGSSEVFDTSSMKGSPTVLVFYPEDDTPVCSSQLALYNEALHLFQKHDAKIFGISVDTPETHKKFAQKLNLKFELLADSDPKGDVARKFNVFNEATKRSKRALIVLDDDANIHWAQVVPDHINPGAEGILAALEDLSKLK